MTKTQAATDRAERRLENFSGLLNALLAETAGEKVTLRQLMDVAGRRTFGPVLLLLGLIAVSPLTLVPGATWLVAAVTLLFSGQILLGLRKPWLPAKLVDAQFPRTLLEQTVEKAAPAARVADKLTAPRLVFLTEPPFVMGTALLCVMAALITFPLGLIPLAPLLPGLSIVLIGIGLTARDGVFLMLSMLSLTGGVLLVARWLL
jgi:hypothetical protein